MKLKRITAIAMSAIMAFSAFGCGSEKKKSTKASKVDVASATSLENTVVLLPDYKTGEFNLTADIRLTKDGQNQDMFVSCTGERAGDDVRTGAYLKMASKGKNIEMNMLNVLSMTGGKAYINVDSLLSAIGAKDTKAGYYAIPAPEFDSKKREQFEKDSEELAKLFLNAILEGAEVSGKDGDFTAKITTAEGYIKSINALVKCASENKDKISELVEKSGDMIDYEKYMDKLIDSVGNDLVDASDVLGMKIEKRQIEAARKSVKEALGNKESGSKFDVGEIIDQFKNAVENTSEEDMKKAFESFKDVAVSITVKAEEKNYNVKAIFNIAANDGSSVSMDLAYKFDSKDVKISKPGNTKSLKEIAQYLKDNPMIFSGIVGSLYSFR